MQVILVTGATGFVGRALVPELLRRGHAVRRALRGKADISLPEDRLVGDIHGKTDWTFALDGVDTIMHLAALVHATEKKSRSLGDYTRVNVEGTLALAQQAILARVRRFVFLSSVKSVADESGERLIDEETPPGPRTMYGRSKLEAEHGLLKLAEAGDMEIVILRSPLIYGPEVGGNFRTLLDLCWQGAPLPVAMIHNKRSLVYIGNVIDALASLIEQPGAIGIYMVSDGEAVSTRRLIHTIGNALQRRVRLLPIPRRVLEFAARTLGRHEDFVRVAGSLALSPARLLATGWRPPYTFEEGIYHTAQWYRREQGLLITSTSAGIPEQQSILYLVTEDWYFLSHRLPMAHAAQKAGFEVGVACRVSEHGEAIRRHGIAVHELKWRRGGWNPLRATTEIVSIARLYRRVKPDIVHHVALKASVFGSIAAALGGRPPVVNALTGLGFLFASPSPALRFVRRLGVFALRVLLNWGDSRLILQNQDDAEYMKELGVALPDRFEVIRGSGIDLDAYEELPEPQGPITATYVGRMIEDKGVNVLIQAHRQLASEGIDLRLMLVGSPDSDNPGSISRNQLNRWQNSPRITWIERCDDIAGVWSKSHIAVLASRREGLPKSLLEAAACGRPIVATDVPGCREIAHHEINALLVPPDNTEALAVALRRLCEDDELRVRLAGESRRMIAPDMLDDQVGASTVDLYRRSLAGSRR